MRNVSDKSCRGNQNTHFVFNNFFSFRRSCCLWSNVEKYGRSEQDTDDNMALAHCMLDTKGYRHALRICNNYCFSTTTMVYERASLLRHMYISCLVIFVFTIL